MRFIKRFVGIQLSYETRSSDPGSIGVGLGDSLFVGGGPVLWQVLSRTHS